VEVVSQVLGILISAAFVWLSFQYVQQSYVIMEGSADPGGLPYRWALKALIPAGFTLLALQSLATLLGVFAKMRELRGAR
jgi:TRAP-type mannitol/chloroaromatic compound transport system permease small subunit